MYLATDFMIVTISINPTDWFHMVFNYIGGSPTRGDSVIIYHDGAEVGSNTQKTQKVRNTGPGVVVIGRYFVQFQEQYFASVMLDELLFFNRYLTAQEVQILYNMHK